MTHPISDELEAIDPSERAAHKAAAFASLTLDQIVSLPGGGVSTGPSIPIGDIPVVADGPVRLVTITDGPYYVDGILQFSVGLSIDGIEVDTSGINPVRVVNPPILISDPAGDITRTWTDADGITQSSSYREDLPAVLMQIATEVTAHL